MRSSNTGHFDVPKTVRAIGMIGGGASSSKGDGGGISSACSPRGTSRQSSTLHFPSSVASPVPKTQGSNASGTPAVKEATPDPEVATRPTITILTELEDSDFFDDGGAKDDQRITSSGVTKVSHTNIPVTSLSHETLHAALEQTETALSPLHYFSMCQATENHGLIPGDSLPCGSFATTLPPAAKVNQSVADLACDKNTEPSFFSSSDGAPSGHHDNSMGLNHVDPHLSAASFATHSYLHDAGMLEAAPPRISATPVVPIVPYVAEPSSRRWVAGEMERLYGDTANSTAASAAAGTDAATAASASQNLSGKGASSLPPPAAKNAPDAVGSSQNGNPSTSAALPDSFAAHAPGKRKSKLSLFSKKDADASAARSLQSNGVSSSKKSSAAKELEAKKKKVTPPPPTTAAARRAEREQIIRIGVQRLYQRLNELHLVVHHVKNDGNCQFRAISHQLFGREEYHDVVRSQVVSYMRAVRASCFDFYFESPAQADAYYANLAKQGSWGDELTLRAASDCLFINIHVLSSEERNFYITYRPSANRTAGAPSFLIDVAKIRERRRAERRMLHSSYNGSGMNTTSSSFPVAGSSATTHNNSVAAEYGGDYGSTPGGGYGGHGSRRPLLLPLAPQSFHNGSGDGSEVDSGNEEVDANALQMALHRKLQHSEIRSSVPLASTLPTLSDHGLGSNGISPQSLPQPLSSSTTTQVGGAFGSRTTLLHPMGAAMPTLLNREEDGRPRRASNQLEKFKAFGAEVQTAEEATQSVNIFTHSSDSFATCTAEDLCVCFPRASRQTGRQQPEAALQRRPSQSLSDGHHRPHDVTAETQSTAASLEMGAAFSSFCTPHRVDDVTGEVLLLACSTRPGKSTRSLQQSFSYVQSANSLGAGIGESFQTEHPGTGVTTVSPGSAGGTPGDHLVVNMVPSSEATALTITNMGAAAAAAARDEELRVSCFKFEPRTEPIDIFLSYLYPVHYNSLSVYSEPAEKTTSAEGGKSSA